MSANPLASVSAPGGFIRHEQLHHVRWWSRCNGPGRTTGLRGSGSGIEHRYVLPGGTQNLCRRWPAPARTMRPTAVHEVYEIHAGASWVSFVSRRPAMRPTVAQLVRDLSVGRYIFRVKGHEFAFVDGVCLDVFPKPAPRQGVEGYWTMNAVAAPRALFTVPASRAEQLELTW